MDIAIVSNQIEYKRLTERIRDYNGLKIICANLAFQDFLKEKNIDFDLIEETIIKDKWEDVNKWACDKALNWGLLAKEGRISFDGVEINQALYVYFSYYLAAFLKNYLYAEYIYKKYSPKNIYIFEISDTAHFPSFNGLHLLNISLKDLQAGYGYKICTFSFNNADRKKNNIEIKDRLRMLAKSVYLDFRYLGIKKNTFMVCGSLRQLDSVIKELKKKKHEVAMYDFDFNAEQLSFCLKEGMAYLLPDFFEKKRYKEENFYDQGADFLKIIDLFETRRWFTFLGYDLTRLICQELRTVSKKYFKEISYASGVYTSVIDALKLRALVVDENWSSTRGFMCAFFKSRGIKTFCVSHGYGAQRFSVDETKGNFRLSETLVHSEYEKSLLDSRGWDKRHIHVTGSPKYDRLLDIKKEYGFRKKEKPVLLFCGTSLQHYTVTQQSYIGVTQFERGSYMQECLRSVLNAIDGFNVRLLIRPHPGDIVRSSIEKVLWEDFIKGYQKKNDIILCSERLDFFNILPICDAMIVGYWTPAIVEALIINIPTLVLNFTGFDDGFPFAKEGLCYTAINVEQIRDFIKQICDGFGSKCYSQTIQANPEKIHFYTGDRDKNNSLHASDKIIKLSL